MDRLGSPSPPPRAGRPAGGTDRDTLRAVLHDYVDRLWNQGDLRAIDDHVLPGYLMDPPLRARANRFFGRDVPTGRAGLRAVAQFELGLFHEYRVRVTRSVVEPPFVMWAHDTHGVLKDPDGRRVHHGGACLYRFEGHWIAALEGVTDVFEYLRQVGCDHVPRVPRVPL